MRKRTQYFICASLFIILNSSFIIPYPAHAQHWWTGWSQQTGLALCLHQINSSPGEGEGDRREAVGEGYAYELYSPLQTSDPIPVSKWSLQGDTLRLECASIGLKMTLIHSCSSPILGREMPVASRAEPLCVREAVVEGCVWSGTWRQGLLKEAITFRPSDTLYQLRRPQTPLPPYRFSEETVTADYTDSQGNAVHLEGTLTYPSFSSPSQGEGDRRKAVVEGCVKYPCLLLVSGSGQQNRDEELFFHKPFLVLADYLASRGIAVLRYDDRGIVASGCSPVSGELSEGLRGRCLDSADTRLFSEDAEAMFNALKTNPHIDPNRLGIGGHSEGGAIAPMVAARNKDVKFVVILAGQGCTGLEVLVQQNEALYRAKGISDSLVAIRTRCMREIFTTTAETRQAASPLTVKDYQSIIAKHTANLTKEQIDSIDLKKGAAYALKQQLDSRWMRSFLTLDPTDYLPKVKCPVLALNGSKDCQVLSRPNLDRIHQLCPQAICRELQNLNHLFQHCETGGSDEYIQIEETFAPEAMKALADWLLSL